ncbi:uncharacterized protein F4812DRAFT_466443 [Daldinia caldariorum]|uniref:uncharacterized protein n=1 Tax=Daldinia caldariorum TaxID=326644 RepID=UPI002007B40A|nr:uncharacterized protein F4812DRAFT_466443 [Daldinia caldariorum]KAI1465469.1 hypothetical protein F4812DRAFT_466443 [Daldinia caldariorum]
MKRKNLALPTLQVAAAAFFAAGVVGVAEAKTYCVDEANKVVAKVECDSDGAHAAGQFFLHQGPPGLAVGQAIPPPAEPSHVSGGFGRRSDDDCDPHKDPDCGNGG